MRYFFALLFFLSPLPLGSAAPVWHWFWTIVIAFSCVVIGGMQLSRQISRKKVPQLPRMVFWGGACWLVFVVWGYVQGAFFSINPAQSLAVSTFVLAHLLLLFLTIRFCSSSKRIWILVKMSGVAGGLYAIYGLGAYIIDPQYILWFERAPDYVGSTDVLVKKVSSTFVNKNNYASYSFIGLMALIVWINSSWPMKSPGSRKGLLALQVVFTNVSPKLLLLLVVSISFVMTGSRGGVFSLAIVSCLALVVSWLARAKPLNRPIWPKAMLLTFVLMFMYISGDMFFLRLETHGLEIGQRLNVYRLVITAILDRPFVGYGLGVFEETFRMYRDADVTYLYTRAHNDYLELALTAGLPATALFVMSLGMLVGEMVIAIRKAGQLRGVILGSFCIVAFLSIHALVDFPFQLFAITLSSVIWLGIGVSASLLSKEQNSTSQMDKQ
jgi:O-antigen ligase